MTNKIMQVAGQEVAPGKAVRCSYPLAELPDGSAVTIPMLLINGAKPGPRLYLGAAIHGDEANGVEILWQALRQVTPASLSGSIVCVPVQGPLAFQSDHRIALASYLKSPLDQSPADPWVIFPGDANGNLPQQLAHHLFELIRDCDFAIDIHTPTRGGRYPPIAILPAASIGEPAARALELAKGFGAPFIIQPRSGFYIADGVLCVEATKRGVPAFTFELGEGGRLEAEMIKEGVRCVTNALRHLKMIDGPVDLPPRTYLMSDFIGLRATRGGLLHTAVTLGATVKRDDLLAQVFDVYGDEVERFTAPQDGIFIRATTLATVSTGERVATLGVLA